MKRTTLASAISYVALVSTTAVPAFAQDEPAGAHRGLEQVIVTARRVEENVQEVPLAITAMSAEQLEKAGVTTVADLAQRAPSVQMSQATGRREATYFAIRGQRADDVLLTVDQAIAVIVGGAPVNWPYGVGQMGALDVSSLEIAKGPQGTLFGKNSTGGAIIITPAEPDQTFAGKVKAGIGNYNQRTLEGMVNGGLTDTLSGRIAANMVKQDGLEKNLDGGEDFNSTDQWAARASLKWQPTDALTHLLVIEGGYSSASAQAVKLVAVNPAQSLGALYAGAFARTTNDGFFEGHSDAPHGGGYNDLKSWGVLNTTTFDVSDAITVKNILGVRDFWYEGEADGDGVNRSTVPLGIQFLSKQFSSAQSLTEELQIIGSTDIADWIGGFYYGKTDGKDGAISVQFNPVGNAAVTGPAAGVVNETIAAFAQSTWHLTDRMNLTTGVRITKDDREVTYNSHRIPNPPFQQYECLLKTTISTPAGPITGAPAGCEQTLNRSFHEPTWNLSLDYKLTDTQMIYGATRHGYRSGGFPGRGTTPDTTQSFDPEKVNDFELGHKFDGDIAGMPLRVNTAIFYQNYKDIQRTVTFTDALTNQLQTTTRNAASGTVSGGEVEFTFLPVDSLELSGFISYIDASYDKWDDKNSTPACQAAGANCPLVDRSVNDFPSVAEKSASLTARYTLPLPPSIGEVSVSANVYWQSKTSLYVDNKRDSTNAECVGSHQGSYKLYNARIDWDAAFGNDALSFSAWGKNLANEEYFASGLCLYNQPVGITVNAPGDPRTYGVTAQYKF